jgi:hypothetical protein
MGFFALGHATTSSEPEKWRDGAKNGGKWDGTVTCVAAPLHHEGVFSAFFSSICPSVARWWMLEDVGLMERRLLLDGFIKLPRVSSSICP